MIAVYLFEPVPELHSGTERSSFSDKFRRPGPEPLVLSVNLAGSGPVMLFIDNLESWIGVLDWSHGVEYWSEMLECKRNIYSGSKIGLV